MQVRPSTSKSDPPSLLWSVGFGATAQVNVAYGVSAPLNLNLTGYDRLRINFGGLSSGLNLNLVAQQGSNGHAAAACSIGLSPSSESNAAPAAFTVDFPLSTFTSPNGLPVDWSNILMLQIVLAGGPDLAVAEFLAIPNGSTEEPARFTCGAPAS